MFASVRRSVSFDNKCNLYHQPATKKVTFATNGKEANFSPAHLNAVMQAAIITNGNQVHEMPPDHYQQMRIQHQSLPKVVQKTLITAAKISNCYRGTTIIQPYSIPEEVTSVTSVTS